MLIEGNGYANMCTFRQSNTIQQSNIYIQAFDLKTASIKVQFPPIHMYK